MQKQLGIMVPALILLAAASAGVLTHGKASSQVTRSPDTNQRSSPVRGLSAQEVDDLLNGRGAGYARMAELNSYPGPAHLLELREPLDLSTEQVQAIEAVFQDMNAAARRIGQDIVEQEQALSTSFASSTITPTELQMQTAALANLYGELRATHLEAHLDVTPMLSSEQIAAYNVLRGYTGGEVPGGHHRH